MDWPVQLWNRRKEINAQTLENGHYLVRAHLDDIAWGQTGCAHPHIALVELEFDPDLMIVHARGEMLNRPYPECEQGLAVLEQLIGIRILPGVTRRVVTLLGGTKGCSHLLSLVLDIINLTVLMPLTRDEYFAFPDTNISEEERLERNMTQFEDFTNRCIVVNDASPVVARVRAKIKLNGHPDGDRG